MTITFEAGNPRIAAEVLNEYLVLIQARDAEFRRGRSGETLDFFVREVERLGAELDSQGKRILEFKQANSDRLPENLRFRLNQQSSFQDRLGRIDREVLELESQRQRLVQLYELTGSVDVPRNRKATPQERQLEETNRKLSDALTIYSETNPRVKVLRARVAQLEAEVSAAAEAAVSSTEGAGDEEGALPAVLTVQLSEVDGKIETLKQQRIETEQRLQKVTESIERTPEATITLDEMERSYGALQKQYGQAQNRLAKAQTGDQIETRSRGQRISVIEQPSVPSQPTKPNRTLIAGGGTSFGILAGLLLILGLELLNTAPRRPEDIIKKLGITPLTTIPYVQTQGQQLRLRLLRLLLAVVILIGVPGAIYLVHIYYLPLDLIADKIMNKIGVRW